ncbi:murein transglycosylase [Amycolatopsis acidiphila]|uniref:Murein transglycosylase n=1 Tax=Amycolatopsis acidiphila TaxID=715473 RepID=A0A558AF26_9PSEU|nr:murein transglycosylase [Amycolatopsis acidiphila]TVT22868.1 murein transglycosylase [Amycolatopsis acidiphila]UIJ63988.1 murein transglycosylase [Amycolatopsis acidiphila]GHG69419.1 murein transglycosylase [Amycolatopsis acidiphila]
MPPAEKQQARTRRAGLAVLGRLAVVVAVLGVAATAVLVTTRVSTPPAGQTTTDIPALSVQAADVQPGSTAPVNATVAGAPVADTQPAQQPQQHQSSGKDLLSVWAAKVASVTGVPARALVGYGNAELAVRESQPGCKISWATLAGIGRIESNHGQYGGAVLQANGYPSKPIVGVPLDGSAGVRAIGDTDGGRFDGDPNYDRAVGPMQFIPGTWAKWGGGYDPQQIDAAALAAAKYLCAGGRDMSSAAGWWQGVLSYNNSVEYAQKVFGLADSYAKAAQVVKVS